MPVTWQQTGSGQWFPVYSGSDLGEEERQFALTHAFVWHRTPAQIAHMMPPSPSPDWRQEEAGIVHHQDTVGLVPAETAPLVPGSAALPIAQASIANRSDALTLGSDRLHRDGIAWGPLVGGIVVSFLIAALLTFLVMRYRKRLEAW